MQSARRDEARSDDLLSLLLPAPILEAVKSSDAESLCSAESFQARRPPLPSAAAVALPLYHKSFPFLWLPRATEEPLFPKAFQAAASAAA